MARSNLLGLEFKSISSKFFSTKFIVLSALVIAACKPVGTPSTSQEANNGPYSDLSKNRAKVTVAIGFTSKESAKPILFCSATLVKDEAFGPEPVIITAAHCDPYDLLLEYDPNFNLSKPLTEHKSITMVAWIPSEKTFVRLHQFRSHPDYDPSKMVHDIAAATIVREDLSKIKTVGSIEKNYTDFIHPDKKIASLLDKEILEAETASDQAHDQLTHYKHYFDLSAFDKAQSAQLVGFGMENNGTGLSRKRLTSSKEDCQADKSGKGSTWDEKLGCYFDEPVGIDSNDQTPRHVVMRVAKIDTKNGLAFFVPRSNYPKEGTCQGDSGGPAFLGGDDSTRLFAVESWGPLICAGGFTARTIAYPHLNALAQAFGRPHPALKK